MDKILEELYRNHRRDLKYPEHFLTPKMPIIKKIDNSQQKQQSRRSNLDQYKHHSMQMKNQSNNNRHTRNRYNRSTTNYMVSDQQQETIRKYNINYRAQQKQLILPAISSRGSSERNSSQNVSARSNFQVNSRHTNISSKSRKSSQYSSRPINQERVARNKLKFRKWVNVIIFLNRLFRKLQIKRDRAKKIVILSANLLDSIYKMIDKHYKEILDKPMTNFQEILHHKIQEPDDDLTPRIVSNLVDFSTRLKQTHIRKDILIFLALVTTNHSPIPGDFLTFYEIQRLEFKRNAFELIRMNQARIKMIVGVFMGIKLLCEYMFKRPWELDSLEIQQKNKDQIKGVLWAYSSYINCAILSYFKKLPKHSQQYIEMLQEKGIKPKKNDKIDDQFFDGVLVNYRKQYNQINNNLIVWINRITHEVMKWQSDNYF